MSGKALKQAQLPFKATNIKSALQVSSGSQRKRKSSEPHHNPKDAKTFKTSLSQTDDERDHESKEEVENLQSNVFNYKDTLNAENCKKTLQAFFKTSNKNCSEESVRVRQALSEPNNIELIAKKTVINHIKQENSEDLEIITIIGNGQISAVESNEQKISVDNKDETPNIERSLNISNSIDNDSIISVSSDELESSVLNSSTQSASASAKMSCDSSEDNKIKLLKVNAHIQPNVAEMKDFTNENLTATENKSEIGAADVQKDIPRKRKRMSVEGARIKTLQRLQVQEEKEQKKIQKLKELEAKKEAKRLKKVQKLKERMEVKEKLLIEKQKRKEKEEMERKEKQRLKMEKRDQEEKERLQKLQEKEEKNKLKQQLLEAKAEEKKKKEEERQKFLEEKKKAEEEEEKKREKTKAAFVNFFVKTKTSELPRVNEPEGAFRPFQVTNGMVLAPVVPEIAQARFDRKLLEQLLLTQDCLMLYLEELKQGKHQSFKHKNNQNKEEIEVDDDVVILDFDDKVEQTGNFNLRPKLLQFCENVRPPYWGTWRKKSQVIRPRNPFGREALFDYDIDSDDEWDEGGPGESLSGTEDEESEDDYEVDNEFFVPHGYLSADEEKDEDNTVDSPELHHARLKAKEYEFEAERCKKTIELKPCIIGCFWEISTIIGNQHLQRALQIYSAEILIKRPIETSFSLAKAKVDENTSILLSPESTSPAGESSSQKRLAKATPKQPVPEEAMPYLIQLLHASTQGRSRVIREFQEFWLLQHNKKDNDNSCKEILNNSFTSPRSPTSPRTGNKEHVSEKCENATPKMSKIQSGKISKRQLEITMQKICIWCKCPNSVINKYCWWVHDDVREKYGLTDLPVPNKWQFVSQKDVGNFQPVSQPVANIGTPSIKNFLYV